MSNNTKDIISGLLARESIALKTGDTSEAEEIKEIGERLQHLHYIAHVSSKLLRIKNLDYLDEYLTYADSLDLKENLPSMFGKQTVPFKRVQSMFDIEHELNKLLQEQGYL